MMQKSLLHITKKEKLLYLFLNVAYEKLITFLQLIDYKNLVLRKSVKNLFMILLSDGQRRMAQ